MTSRIGLRPLAERFEHLVAELNHVVHGRKSEKLDGDDQQLAFEDLEIAVAETRRTGTLRVDALADAVLGHLLSDVLGEP